MGNASKPSTDKASILEKSPELKFAKKYKTLQKCFFNNCLYNEGDVIKTDKADVPDFFVEVK